MLEARQVDLQLELDRLRVELEELRARKVPGVHLGVDARNQRAFGVYEHLGFDHLDDTDDVVMGMRLDQG